MRPPVLPVLAALVLPDVQAAAAVYERADTGLLAGVRIYDDIEHPFQQN